MSNEATFTDLTRLDAAAEAGAEFVMDEEAFRGFYDRTARGLWAYLVRVTGNRESADDLLQESYYRFLRAAATHESEAHRRNSLYRIAGNLVRDARRRDLVRLPFSAPRADVERLPGRDPAGPAERTSDLTRCLERLKPRERAMLWLAYAEGATHEEISGALGVRPASLKAMLFRARRKLAGLLGGPKEGGQA